MKYIYHSAIGNSLGGGLCGARLWRHRILKHTLYQPQQLQGVSLLTQSNS